MEDQNLSQTGSPDYTVPQRQPPPPRILVVDDDVSNRQLVTEVLIQSGYEADPVADGAAGWEALQTRAYDLLITDNFMPRITGLEMVKLLRGSSATLPVIMATGAIPTDELQRHPWLKISAFLIKPYGVGHLLRTVKKLPCAKRIAPRKSSQPLPYRAT